MKHELKIWPQHYKRVVDGTLTFQVRDNDREFQRGDTVTLKEWDPEPINTVADRREPKGFTASAELLFEVGFVHILDTSKVVFSLLPIPKDKKKA